MAIFWARYRNIGQFSNKVTLIADVVFVVVVVVVVVAVVVVFSNFSFLRKCSFAFQESFPQRRCLPHSVFSTLLIN